MDWSIVVTTIIVCGINFWVGFYLGKRDGRQNQRKRED